MSNGELMTDFRAGGGQYVTYREHISAKEEAAKKMAALELEQAAQRAALMHLPEDVRQLTQAVNALANKMNIPLAAPSADNQTLLAIQRTLDVLSKQQTTPATELIKLLHTPPPTTGKTWALVGALAVVAVMLGWRAFVG
jgi:pullulanase/glycogen debranching enzyme